MKTRYATRFVPFLLLFALACSDNPVGGVRAVQTNPNSVISPTGTLDQNIVGILTLLPKGLETAATTRWANVKAKYATGLSDPSQMAVAKQMLFDLSTWVKMKAPDMDTPPNAESKTSAAARAVLYMSLYIFNGPTSPPPSYNPGADAVVGLVTPGAAATVVTPTLHAGVQFEAGSVAENTIIVVTQNLTPFPANCSGPLQTGLCQYPQFYTFEQFPHKALLKAAKFSVCHINGGTFRSPLRADIHDRFRLAHTKPANPADYTPGSIIRDQPGESIEILPLITQNFTVCDNVQYTPEPPPIGVIGAITGMGRAFASLVTPKTAYAIDQGGGGVSRFFSPFNDVDPLGLPDRSVQSFSVTPVCGDCAVHPGDHVRVSYNVKNIGTAAAIGVPATIHLLPPPPIEGPPLAELSLLPASIPTLVPNDSSIAINLDATIPPDAPIGEYTVKMTVGGDVLPEEPGNLDNNSKSVPLSIGGAVIAISADRAFDDFAIAYYGNGLAPQTEGQATLSALFTDEFAHAETFASRLEIDRRAISVDNPTIAGAFRDIQRARANLDEAARQLSLADPGTFVEGELVAFSGISDVVAAENWCSGMPTSVVNASGAIIEGAQMTTTQLLDFANTKFEVALAIANRLGTAGATLSMVANVGKARALLDLNHFADAAAAAAAVPTLQSFVFGPNNVRNNGVYAFQNVGRRWTVSDNEGANGLPYRSDNDPRVPFQTSGVGFDLTTPLFVQLKYPDAASFAPVASGMEARLIEAEAFMRLGNLPQFTSNINLLRAQFGLSGISIPLTLTEAQEVLFKERAYDLWLTSHRLGDLRRMVRQYGLSPSTVFPSGEYAKGGSYGTDMNFPIPVDAQFNPRGLACLDRNP